MLRKQDFGEKKLIRKITSYIKDNISNSYKPNSTNNIFSHMNKKDILIAHVPKIDISSTMIRKLVKQRSSIKNLTPSVVAKQIYEKGLYL